MSQKLTLALAALLLTLACAAGFGSGAAFAADSDLRVTPVVRAVRRVSPAVVNITTTQMNRRGFKSLGPGLDDFFAPFFREFFNAVPQQQNYARHSLGSGVIIDGKKALVLSNAHVISGATTIIARLIDGREYQAELVGSSPDLDLAVLHLLKAKDLPQATMMDSDEFFIGETVIAIGNPFGFNHTVTTGVISALHRSVKTSDGVYTDFIQTDAAINPGNSGGPLCNILGELIGINTAMHASAQGIGFAIPITKAKSVIKELVHTGKVSPVWFGLSGQSMDQRTASYFGLDHVHGMLVTDVLPGPAKDAGIRNGDVVLELNGVSVEDKDHYLSILRNYFENEKVRFTVLQQGKKQTLTVRAAPFTLQNALDLAAQRWGFTPGQARSRDTGLPIAEIIRGGPASQIGLIRGDSVLRVENIPLRNNDDFLQAVLRFRLNNNVILQVARGNRAYLIQLQLR